MGEADLMHSIPVKIEEATALGPLAAAKDVETGCGKGLMDERLGILFEQLAGRHVQVLIGPSGAVRRDVEVALGLEAVEWGRVGIHAKKVLTVKKVVVIGMANVQRKE
jgi:hypothetical protein